MSQDNISKRDFWNFVNSKSKNIHYYHIGSVINILFEEIAQDLKDGKVVKIYNFGEISLQETKPKKYFDVRYQKVMLSGGAKILKFAVAPLLRKKLCSALDLDKTFKDD
jgi:nucleoid DNA-binding protein